MFKFLSIILAAIMTFTLTACGEGDKAETVATKFIQDSLVRTGILEDDSRKYINQVNHSVFTDKENPRIVVEIIDGGEQNSSN